jgi:hypothetical protein
MQQRASQALFWQPADGEGVGFIPGPQVLEAAMPKHESVGSFSDRTSALAISIQLSDLIEF